MGSYRSSGRGIQVPLLAIANEFIRIHVYTCLHVHTYEILYLGQNPPFGNPTYAPAFVALATTAAKMPRIMIKGSIWTNVEV